MNDCNDKPELTVKGGGVTAIFKGYRGVPWLLVAALTGTVGWMVREHTTEARAMQVDTNSALRELVVISKLGICLNGKSQEQQSVEFENPNSRCWQMARMK